MAKSKLFIDTSFIQAIANKNDNLHEIAVKLRQKVIDTKELWIHEGILIEVADGLSAINRTYAVNFYDSCHKDKKFRVVSLSPELIKLAFEIYDKHKDKDWGLTDCISFCVMKANGIFYALTADHHFEQMGFKALMKK